MRYIHNVALALLALLFGVMVVVGTMQVVNRSLFNSSLSWSEELQKFTFIWAVFIAIPVAYVRKSHLRVDVLVDMMPPRLAAVMGFVTDILWLILGLAFVFLTWKLMSVARYQQSAGLGISMAWAYSGMLIGGAYLTLCASVKLIARRHVDVEVAP